MATVEKTEKTMNIYQRMSAATEKINKVAKNLKIGVGQNQYKAVGEADVLEAVKPVEAEYGVYSFPLSRRIIDSKIFTTTSTYNGNTTEKNNFFMRLETVYRFVNVDNPNEYIDITTFGDGVDLQDKAPGKAMTYSDKYALLKAYKIETGEDTDQHASESMKKAQDARQNAKDEKQDEEEEKTIKNRKINEVQLKSLEQAVDETNTDIDALFRVMNYIGKQQDLTFEQWKTAMTLIEKKKEKVSKNPSSPLDL